MKCRVYLETLSDVNKFVNIATSIEGAKIYLTDSSNFCVSAKSIIGAIYSLEFDEIWLYSDKDVYSKFAEFI